MTLESISVLLQISMELHGLEHYLLLVHPHMNLHHLLILAVELYLLLKFRYLGENLQLIFLMIHQSLFVMILFNSFLLTVEIHHYHLLPLCLQIQHIKYLEHILYTTCLQVIFIIIVFNLKFNIFQL